MAVHENIGDLVMEAIDEYIQAAYQCLETKKADGGCLGLPATLLLLCVVDAMGRYLIGEQVTIEGKPKPITKGEPFMILNHRLFDLDLSREQIKRIEVSFRNRLAHNALIDPDCILAPGVRAEPFQFLDGKIVIWVKTLFGAVSSAWEDFEESRIHTGAEAEIACRKQRQILSKRCQPV